MSYQKRDGLTIATRRMMNNNRGLAVNLDLRRVVQPAIDPEEIPAIAPMDCIAWTHA